MADIDGEVVNQKEPWDRDVRLWFESPESAAQQVEFLSSIIAQAPTNKVAEISCSSGYRAAALSRLADTLICTQSNDTLISHLKAIAPEVDVHETTARELGRVAPPRSLGVVLCIDNNMAFLHSEPEVEQVLAQFADVLVDEGSVILELDNYTRILQHHIRDLPLQQTKYDEEDMLLFPQYEAFQDGLRLHLNLFRRQAGSWVVTTESKRVLPLEHSSLITVMRQAGFTQFRSFGNFAGEEYRPLESERLIVVAVKAKRGAE